MDLSLRNPGSEIGTMTLLRRQTVRSSVMWSDGGGEFLFDDGVAIIFGPNLDTFVQLKPASPPSQVDAVDRISAAVSRPERELCFTSTCLCKDRDRLAAALSVHNTFHPRPKLLRQLLPTETIRYWTSPAPINQVVYSIPADLTKIRGEMLENEGFCMAEVFPNGSVMAWDSPKKMVTLTLSPNGKLCHVAWPAPVYDSDGTSLTFLRPAPVLTSLQGAFLPASSQRAIPFVMLEQHFFSSDIVAAAQYQYLIDQKSARTAPNDPQLLELRRHKLLPLAVFAPLLYVAASKWEEAWPSLASRANLPDPEAPGTAFVPENIPEEMRITSLFPPEFFSQAEHLDRIIIEAHLPSTLPPVDRSQTSACFPPAEPEHLASLLAAKRFLHSASCQEVLHSVQRPSGSVASVFSSVRRSPPPFCTFRYERDDFVILAGTHLCSSFGEDASLSPLIETSSLFHAVSHEDGSVLEISPLNLPYEALNHSASNDTPQALLSAPSMFFVEHNSAKHPASVPKNFAREQEGDPYVPCISQRKFSYATDQSIPVPTPPGGNSANTTRLSESASKENIYNPGLSITPQKKINSEFLSLLETPIGSHQAWHGTSFVSAYSPRAGNSRAGLDFSNAANALQQSLAPSQATDDALWQMNLSQLSASHVAAAATGKHPRRYLPELLSIATSMMQCNHRRTLSRSMAMSTAGKVASTSPISSGTGNLCTASTLVRCSSVVPEVGVFTAFTNGLVRCAFDDRTILTLSPDESDSEHGLVCTAIDRKAMFHTIRVIQCRPDHHLYPYLVHAISFKRFSQLSEKDRANLSVDLEREQFQEIQRQQAATHAQVSHPNGTQKQNVSAVSEVEILLYRTRQALQQAAESSTKTQQLLSIPLREIHEDSKH